MKRHTRNLLATITVGVMALIGTGCSQTRGGDTASSSGDDTTAVDCAFSEDGLIGVSMPTKYLERWSRDGSNLENLLKEQGFSVDIQYADDKVEQQISQIENMINGGVEVLVVASIDGSALDPVLTQASEQGIPVIAYDRLIRDTEAVDYYATFDNYVVGQLQGAYIVETLDLENSKGPYNLELFAGSPDDNNARFFFEGAWDQLQPYIERGQLVVPSGKLPASVDEWQSIGIPTWDGAKAQSEMETRLNSFYRDKKVDAILSPNDSLALGIAQALQDDGYTSENWPILTGQDADLANIQNLSSGKQSMDVWKDTRALADQVSTMVGQITSCETVEVNDTESYDNGNKVVPSYLLEPVVVTKDNLKETLVDSGYYTEEEIG